MCVLYVRVHAPLSNESCTIGRSLTFLFLKLVKDIAVVSVSLKKITVIGTERLQNLQLSQIVYCNDTFSIYDS